MEEEKRKSNERGKVGEDLAAKYLRRKGYQILARNFRCRQGEIDLIAQEGDILVFLEVKMRSSGAAGLGREYVGLQKQRRIIIAAEQYLAKYPWEGPCRFDVIELQGPLSAPRITHIKQAFEAN